MNWSSGVSCGVNGSTSSESVPGRAKAEPPDKTGSDSDSLWRAQTLVSNIEFVASLDQTSDGKRPNQVLENLI